MMKKRYLWAAAYCVAICVLCCGCGKKGGTIVIGNTKESGQESVSGESADAEETDPIEEASKEEANICVYVCGAVVNPGVVEISAGSRASDALLAAGGFSGDAAREAVNLADWVTDGQMLYFPTEGEAAEIRIQETETALGLVNINTADAAALCTLPGIGESRAADIISYRESNGPFESCEDIMKVPGIKTAAYEKIREKITVK